MSQLDIKESHPAGIEDTKENWSVFVQGTKFLATAQILTLKSL